MLRYENIKKEWGVKFNHPIFSVTPIGAVVFVYTEVFFYLG